MLFVYKLLEELLLIGTALNEFPLRMPIGLAFIKLVDVEQLWEARVRLVQMYRVMSKATALMEQKLYQLLLTWEHILHIIYTMVATQLKPYRHHSL
jgi:hypothetical protein